MSLSGSTPLAETISTIRLNRLVCRSESGGVSGSHAAHEGDPQTHVMEYRSPKR